jgi:hypothetical protein
VQQDALANLPPTHQVSMPSALLQCATTSTPPLPSCTDLQLILPDVHFPDDKSLYEPIKDNIANILDITGTSSLEIAKFITNKKGIYLQILLLPHNFNFFKYHICQ